MIKNEKNNNDNNESNENNDNNDCNDDNYKPYPPSSGLALHCATSRKFIVGAIIIIFFLKINYFLFFC